MPVHSVASAHHNDRACASGDWCRLPSSTISRALATGGVLCVSRECRTEIVASPPLSCSRVLRHSWAYSRWCHPTRRGRRPFDFFSANEFFSVCSASKKGRVIIAPEPDIVFPFTVVPPNKPALHQILLYENSRKGGDLIDNVAFLISLNCPLNGCSVYDPPLLIILRTTRPQQLKMIKMLVAAGAECEAARNIANQKFENLWDIICAHSESWHSSCSVYVYLLLIEATHRSVN